MFLCFYVFMFLCLYVFMFLCFYVFMLLCFYVLYFYVFMFLCFMCLCFYVFYVFMFLCFYIFMFLCFYVFMFLCCYVFMFLCFYVCMLHWSNFRSQTLPDSPDSTTEAAARATSQSFSHKQWQLALIGHWCFFWSASIDWAFKRIVSLPMQCRCRCSCHTNLSLLFKMTCVAVKNLNTRAYWPSHFQLL